MPLSHHGQSRSARENLILAFSLASVAGIVNAVGFFELSVFTSNMSGHSTRLGESLATHNTQLAFQSVIILCSFLAGAMTATFLAELARVQQRARYVIALLLEAVVLCGATLAIEFVADPSAQVVYAISSALAFAMGLQNALVTHISGAVVRTTHLTGIVTDFGIELVHLGFNLRRKLERSGGRGLWSALLSLKNDETFYKARLHSTIFLSFLSGGAMGTALHLNVGRPAMALPVLILVSLVIYDQWLQNQWRRFIANLAHRGHDNDSDQLEPESPPKRTGS